MRIQHFRLRQHPDKEESGMAFNQPRTQFATHQGNFLRHSHAVAPTSIFLKQSRRPGRRQSCQRRGERNFRNSMGLLFGAFLWLLYKIDTHTKKCCYTPHFEVFLEANLVCSGCTGDNLAVIPGHFFIGAS